MTRTTRDMSDAHEDYLVALLGGRKTKGSGNQWQNPSDGRQRGIDQAWSFSWDGKSTFAQSASITLPMWGKIREQARPDHPAIPLRFYANENLEVAADLIAVELSTFAALEEDANAYHRLLKHLGLDYDWEARTDA